MAVNTHVDDCTTENGVTFVRWIKRSLKEDPSSRDGLTDVNIHGSVGAGRPGSAMTLYPVRFSYAHIAARGVNPAQEYSWAYCVQQDHDDDERFVPMEHIVQQMAYLQRELDKGKISARLEGAGLDTKLVVSKKN